MSVSEGKEVILLTSPRCPECVRAKKMLKDGGVKFREVLVTTDEGLEIGVKYRLTHVPALIAEGKVYVGVEEIKSFIRARG